MPGVGEQKGGNFRANLAVFAAQLREAGLPVGTSELMDALKALENIDLSQRAAFKTALQATMVKDHRHRPAFKRLFDTYFVPEQVRGRRIQEAARRSDRLDRELQEARRSLRFKGEPLRLSKDEMLLYTSLPEAQRQGLQNFVRQTEEGKNVQSRFRPVLETVVKGRLRYWRDQQNRAVFEEPPLDGGPGGEGAGRGGAAENLRQVDIDAIREGDLSAAEALVYRMSQQLARKIIRRRRGARRGPLDLRRSIRDNLRFGGTVFHLRFRRRRPPRHQLLLICDVSASMQRFSTFVLQFIYGLQSAVHNLESFCFADGLEYLSPELKERGGLRHVLDRVVKRGRAWGGGTNLAAALEQLQRGHVSLFNSRTTVLVVSDTRTVALDPSLEALQRLKDRVGRVFWLNPLPPEQWCQYRSVAEVGALVEMWPCNTLAQLEQAVSGRLFKGAGPNTNYQYVKEGGAR